MRVNPKSGIKYPYDKVINFVSNLTSGSRDCFVCGKYITTVGPNARKEHGPEMMMRKSGIYFEPMDS